MEFKKWDDDAIESNLNQCAYGSKDSVEADWGVAVDYVHNIKDKKWNFASDAESESYDDIKKEKHEKFSVWEPNAVWYPWTVMVHVKYATLASGTVVASTVNLKDTSQV